MLHALANADSALKHLNRIVAHSMINSNKRFYLLISYNFPEQHTKYKKSREIEARIKEVIKKYRAQKIGKTQEANSKYATSKIIEAIIINLSSNATLAHTTLYQCTKKNKTNKIGKSMLR